MRSIVNLAKQLKADEDGAPLFEYTVLLGILLGLSILILTAVGTWINGQWTSLNSAI